MKTSFKAISLLLASLFVLCVFVACQPAPDDQTLAVTTAGPAETDVVTDRLFADVPDSLSFNGESITFLTNNGDGDGDWACRDIYVETETEDPIETAVYRRNTLLEEKYKVTIVEETVTDSSGLAQRSIKAGSDDYQVLMLKTAGILSLMQSNLLRDLNEVGGIDLSQPWWDQNLVKNCSIGGKNYFATGDISIMDNDATWVLMFNKELLRNLDLESPYELIQKNEWTYDKMYEMMKDAALDDGDTKIDKMADTFGWATHDSSREALYYAAGLSVVSKNDADIPVINTKDTEYTVQVLTMAQKLWSDPAVTCNASLAPALTMPQLQEVFQSGRALFLGEVLQLVIRLREMDIDFGLIPYPKFSSTQENYGHFVHGTTVLLAIPITCQDYENVSYFVEAMACESMYTLTLAYYDTALKNSYLRDPESTQMLDIILASRTFDLGSVHMMNFGSIASIFTGLLTSGKNTYASDFKKKSAKADKEIAKFVTKVTKEN